jgi:hypothetical protein
MKLCNGQPAGKAGEIPVMVFNPHPYPVTEDIEVAFQLEDQNRNDNEYTLARVRDKDSNYLPAQNEKEAVLLTAYKKIGDGKYFARLFNTAAVPNTATLEANGNAFDLNFGPYYAKAYIISGNTIAETALAYIDYIEE